MAAVPSAEELLPRRDARFRGLFDTRIPADLVVVGVGVVVGVSDGTAVTVAVGALVIVPVSEAVAAVVGVALPSC